MKVAFAVASLSLVAGCGSGDGAPIADAETARVRLGSASPGERVCLAAGDFRGPFQVPAGVIFCGAGADLTTVSAPAGMTTITLAPGSESSPTTVEAMTIRADGAFATEATGEGDVAVRDARIEVPGAGGGISVEMVGLSSVTDVEIRGSVNAGNAAMQPAMGTVTDTATHGVRATGTVVALEDVEVSGFAETGVRVTDGTLRFLRGTVSEVVGTGVVIDGGDADLESVVVERTLQGMRALPATGVVLADGAVVDTRALEVTGSEGYGILQSDSSASHADLRVTESAQTGIWVQDSDGLVLADAFLEGNHFEGVFATQSSNLTFERVAVARTRIETRITGAASAVEVGDGLSLFASNTNVRLEEVQLIDNERVGVLFDLDGGTFDDIDIASIEVSAMGEGLGAVAQNGTIPPDWDANITRNDVAEANDAAFTGTL